MTDLFTFWREMNRREAADMLGLTYDQYLGKHAATRENFEAAAKSRGLDYETYMRTYQPQVRLFGLDPLLHDLGDEPYKPSEVFGEEQP